MDDFYLRHKCVVLVLFFAGMAVLLSSCVNIQDKATELGSSGKVGKAQMSAFLDVIKDKVEPDDPNFFTYDKLDTNKVASFIYNTCLTAGIKINRQDIYNGSAKLVRPSVKPILSIYIEDSESMDAYVSGVTGFKDAIYSLAGSIITADTLTQGINLYYINNAIQFRRQTADANTLLQFIQNLDPSTFRNNGGNRKSSDMRGLLQQVLDSTDDRHVNVLISDFVFSPGQHQDATSYLQQQSTGIKIAIAQKIEQYDLAIEILQMHSHFSGIYFDQHDKRVPLTGDRPFYIWLIGSKKKIKAIGKSGVLTTIKGGVDNTLVFYKQSGPSLHSHKILFSHKDGDFEIQGGASGDMSTAKPNDVNNTFGFDMLVNYKKEMEDIAFFDDTNNYTHNPNYKLTISRLQENDDPASVGYTHCLHLSTQSLQEQKIQLFTVAKVPTWVTAHDSENDTNIGKDPSQMNKTFGLQYLIQGLYEAFYTTPHQNKITEVEITIKK
ncbi:hypothetical protein [Mucilaginibacter sp. SP1R1]|uniref:hypothetical protein n=1 Tax=Mucilaginibacter sp. SP1R1 TaxID=2723091 RepID=UPI001609ACAB|nr:hypothetical protein [Mucilaginibacter sp. SP1R1]MBB6152381.1 hypothetical protein [Mucilaginibacter sp. SP1R1]